MSELVVHPPSPVPDRAVSENLHRAAGHWAERRRRAEAEFDWPEWRARATAIRADAVRHLPELIERLEAEVTRAGGRVHHARTAADACATVVGICRAHGARLAVKSKSMTSEEIGLNGALEAAGITAVETDLGEWIVQLREERPSHLLAPAVHLSAAEIAALFARLAGRAFDPADTEGLVAYARGELRRRFLEAEVGISGVNFAVAETGTLVLVESEGNIRLSTSLPRVHIAVMGIEKVVRDWPGTAHLVQMLPLAAHGVPAAAYTSFVTGPARDGDDGPRELHVVLLDDGRSAIRGTELEEALHCIRCGACLYACPVYRQVGGHAYGTTYSGPIGAVLTPLLDGVSADTAELPWMSSLCGACTDACPVGIPLDEQLVTLRAASQRRHPKHGEAALFEGWARLWSRPGGYRATARTAGRALRPLLRPSGDGWTERVPFPFEGWTSTREAKAPAPEPFHVRWRKARG